MYEYARLVSYIRMIRNSYVFYHIRSFCQAGLPIALLGATLALVGLGAGPWRLVKKECCYDGK